MNFLAGDEKRFYEFMSGLDETDKIAVIAHDDGDGLGSAVIASKIIGKVDYLKFYDFIPGSFLPMLEEMKRKKINKIFFLDMSLPENELLEISKFAGVVIIDHHPFSKDLNSENVIFLKVESKYPACYLCYYLFSKIQQVPEWIAEIGTLSDTAYKYSKEEISNFYRDFGFSEIDNLWEKTFDLILALVYFSGKTKNIYDLLMKSSGFSELEIGEYSEIVRKELENQIKEYEKKKEEHDGLIFYYFEPSFAIKSLIINKLSAENYEKTLVFAQKSGNEDSLEISSRSQSGKVNCPELLKKALMGIPNSNAGGHYNAAGGRIPTEYLGKFKENLLREY
ncbi:MAG: hypothetical protein KKB21_04240, partial [Nanoarchaeota archaeon]|nr:hypothetical protein [Nanoarchaeota archaeon]